MGGVLGLGARPPYGSPEPNETTPQPDFRPHWPRTGPSFPPLSGLGAGGGPKRAPKSRNRFLTPLFSTPSTPAFKPSLRATPKPFPQKPLLKNPWSRAPPLGLVVERRRGPRGGSLPRREEPGGRPRDRRLHDRPTLAPRVPRSSSSCSNVSPIASAAPVPAASRASFEG